jgi:DNA-binding NarL/FixJ family response regulator
MISENTVERHLDNIYNKLDISSRVSAAVYAVQNGLAG